MMVGQQFPIFVTKNLPNFNQYSRDIKTLRNCHRLNKRLFSSAADDRATSYLKEISEEQDFTVTYVDVEEKSKSDKFHCFIQISTNPVAVCFGVGEHSAADARIDAARNALEYLRVMTK